MRSLAREFGIDFVGLGSPPVEVIANYARDNLLMSGWAMGEERYLPGKAAMVSVALGSGRVVLFGVVCASRTVTLVRKTK